MRRREAVSFYRSLTPLMIGSTQKLMKGHSSSKERISCQAVLEVARHLRWTYHDYSADSPYNPAIYPYLFESVDAMREIQLRE
jgi:hypothetical protein